MGYFSYNSKIKANWRLCVNKSLFEMLSFTTHFKIIEIEFFDKFTKMMIFKFPMICAQQQ